MKSDRHFRSRKDPTGWTYDIRWEGHAITGGPDRLLTIPKLEMTNGKLFNCDGDRLHVQALLLECVGIDEAVKLEPPNLWRAAVKEVVGP